MDEASEGETIGGAAGGREASALDQQADEQGGETGEQEPGTRLRAEACSLDVHGTPFG